MPEEQHYPAYPTPNLYTEGAGTQLGFPGFTKREAVVLHFAEALIQHYSRMSMASECVFMSRSYPEIMEEAQNLADAYFESLTTNGA